MPRTLKYSDLLLSTRCSILFSRFVICIKLSTHNKNKTFQENVEECKSAAEFLLEPWVLLQLPFQPALLHQWCVALMAEALRFRRDLSAFCYIPFQMRRIFARLFWMCNAMCSTSLNYFYKFADYIYTGASCYTLDHLSETLTILEFVLSDEYEIMMKALKRMAWSKANRPQIKLNPSRNDDILLDTGPTRVLTMYEKAFFCYNKEMWKDPAPVHSMCPQEPRKVEVSDFMELYVHVKPKDDGSELEGLKRLVDEKLIATGILIGMDRKDILSAVERCQELIVPYYRACMTESG